MKVSIITVVYNNKEFIHDAIESVRSQDYPDVEHIVVDGASTDGTVEVLKSYSHLKWYSEKDRGLYDAMNKGVSLATGDIVGLLNSDDLFKNEYVISSVVEKFQSEDPDIVFGDLEYIRRDHSKTVVRTWRTGQYYDQFFEDGLVPPHPTVYLKRNIYDDYKFNLNYKLAADYEFLLRLFKSNRYKIAHLPKVFISMRLGGVTNKSLGNILNQNREIRRAWKSNAFKIPYLFWWKRMFFKLKQFFV